MNTRVLWDIESLAQDRFALVAFALMLGTLYPIEHECSLSNPYLELLAHNLMKRLYEDFKSNSNSNSF
jgi:hypothetical protein